jgi:threonine synthase
VYYVSAYCELVSRGAIASGQEINFCVPTGNFGNILAGYYAKSMGLPVKTLICASNRNDVLTDFIKTGVYDRNRKFFTTASPSMDILVSSNLERLLFQVSGGDDKLVASYMDALSVSGKYEVSGEILAAVQRDFACGCCDDVETVRTIERVFRGDKYLIDTHTAVAYSVLQSYREKTGDLTPAVVVSTASAFKFCDSVLHALAVAIDVSKTGVDLIDVLAKETGCSAPPQLSALRGKKVRFNSVTINDAMLPVVDRFLGGK